MGGNDYYSTPKSELKVIKTKPYLNKLGFIEYVLILFFMYISYIFVDMISYP